jgi:hypothetical protein
MEILMSFEQKLIFWIRETMRQFDWHFYTVLVFAYLVAYYQALGNNENEDRGFYFPNVILQEFSNLNPYIQNKALKELEERGIVKISRRGLKNRRYIELSLFIVQDILSNIDMRFDQFYYELSPQ